MENTFIEGLHNKSLDINDALDRFFVSGQHHCETVIQDCMRYSLCSGGKRIRPILMLEAGKLFGLEQSDLMEFACALEMIHTYSLVHDDLPAMDDDDLRRGKPTNHKVYGEAMAILAGDGLLNHAYELMSKKAIEADDMKYVKAMYHVATAAGYKGMIGGQVADILSENQPGERETLDFIHENKTGRLLAAPLMVVGYVASCDDLMMKCLERFGLTIGLMFQIKDDLLDIESTEEMLGKPIGSDDKNQKLTYPSLYGTEASHQKMNALKSEADEIIDHLPGDGTFLRELVEFLMYRKK